MKRRQKAGFLSPRSFKITVTKEKKGENERARRRKDGEEKKAMVALLVFIIATSFGDSFWPETLLDAKRSILTVHLLFKHRQPRLVSKLRGLVKSFGVTWRGNQW